MLFSIVIPVFNAELFLEKCVNSILAQSFDDYEIILVNDGSTDNSLQVCNEFKNRYTNVVIVDKKNGGAASARNEGIRAARGEYLLFIDSDDYWIDNDALISLSQSITTHQPELILFGATTYNIVNNKLSVRAQFSNKDLLFLDANTTEENIKYLYEHGLFPTSAWSLAVNTKFVISNELFFYEDIVAEDVDWILSIFVRDTKISAIENNIYKYHKLRPGSVTSMSGEKAVASLLYIADKWSPILTDSRTRNDVLLKFLAFHYSTLFLSYAKMESAGQRKYQKDVMRHFWLLDEVKSTKVKLIRTLCEIFGLSMGSRILSVGYDLYIRFK